MSAAFIGWLGSDAIDNIDELYDGLCPVQGHGMSAFTYTENPLKYCVGIGEDLSIIGLIMWIAIIAVPSALAGWWFYSDRLDELSDRLTKLSGAKAADAPQYKKSDLEKYKLAQQYFEKGDAYYYGSEDEHGTEIAPDFKEAVKWLFRAAELGNNEAQYELALAHCNGEGVPKDYVQAYKWFHISEETPNVGTSATLLNPTAEQHMRDIEKYMTAEQIAEAQKLACEWRPK